MIPNWLVIQGSIWYSITIYTKTDIPKGHVICVTTSDNLDTKNCHVKTPHGDVFNHSGKDDEVNCEILEKGNIVKIVAKRDIESGEELLADYDDYFLEHYAI